VSIEECITDLQKDIFANLEQKETAEDVTLAVQSVRIKLQEAGRDQHRLFGPTLLFLNDVFDTFMAEQQSDEKLVVAFIGCL